MKRKNHKASGKRSGGSLAQAVALLGLALGAAAPMAGCSSEHSSAEAPASAGGDTATQEQGGGATNPCAVKKKKGPCAVGG